MEGLEDLFSDQHVKELVREAHKEISRRGMLDRIQPEEIISLMLFPCQGDAESSPNHSTWASFLHKLSTERKPTEKAWPAFLEDILKRVRAEISRKRIENVVDAADVVLRILPELRDDLGAPVPSDQGWREITRLRFAYRKDPQIPWSVFLKWEIHNTFRTHFRRLIREDARGVPFEPEVDDAEEANGANSPAHLLGVPPHDFAEEDALARLTKLADWAACDLVKSGFITAGLKADHVRELILEFMNSNHAEGWASLSSDLTLGDSEWARHKRAFQKNFGRWRNEILSYLRNRYEAEMRTVAGRRK